MVEKILDTRNYFLDSVSKEENIKKKKWLNFHPAKQNSPLNKIKVKTSIQIG